MGHIDHKEPQIRSKPAGTKMDWFSDQTNLLLTSFQSSMNLKKFQSVS